MNLLQATPAAYRSLVDVLLMFSLLSAFFTFLWPGVRMVLGWVLSLSAPRVHWDELLTMTLGHGMFAYTLALTVLHASASWKMVAAVCGGVILYTFIVAMLYETVMANARNGAERPRLWLGLGLVLLLIMMTSYVVMILAWQRPGIIGAALIDSMQWLINLPWAGVIIALVGIVVLFPQIIQGMFGSIGIIESAARAEPPRSL